mmetsp:Transcript_104950/g.297079  ORF Transcript_104950/g.297079 Transcript_104950/m.297079 type:complete len:246 (-) Transcript_104950:821-1558(-)
MGGGFPAVPAAPRVRPEDLPALGRVAGIQRQIRRGAGRVQEGQAPRPVLADDRDAHAQCCCRAQVQGRRGLPVAPGPGGHGRGWRHRRAGPPGGGGAAAARGGDVLGAAAPRRCLLRLLLRARVHPGALHDAASGERVQLRPVPLEHPRLQPVLRPADLKADPPRGERQGRGPRRQGARLLGQGPAAPRGALGDLARLHPLRARQAGADPGRFQARAHGVRQAAGVASASRVAAPDRPELPHHSL